MGLVVEAIDLIMEDVKYSKYFGISIHHLSSATLDVIEYCEKNNMVFPDWLGPTMDTWPKFAGSLYAKANGKYVKEVFPTFSWFRRKRYDSFAEAAFFIIEQLEGKWWWAVDGKYAGNVVFEKEEDAMTFKLRWM